MIIKNEPPIYLPVGKNERKRGCWVSALGHAAIPPAAVYPSEEHPQSHLFDWERGRLLPGFQMIYLSEGRGTFESKATGKVLVEKGTFFVLFPNLWHRYRPDPRTGWEEWWIEVGGEVWERLQEEGVLHPKEAVWKTGRSAEIERVFRECHHHVQEKQPGFAFLAGSLSLQWLALALRERERFSQQKDGISEAIRQTQLEISTAIFAGEKIKKSGGEWAAQWGISYSHFRREFHRQTGFSLKQYQLETQMMKARQLLKSRALTLDQIAEQLGFYSGFHFSNAFKNKMGLSPQKWKKQ
jgi:AraC-like DNA-binding protein